MNILKNAVSNMMETMLDVLGGFFTLVGMLVEYLSIFIFNLMLLYGIYSILAIVSGGEISKTGEVAIYAVAACYSMVKYHKK